MNLTFDQISSNVKQLPKQQKIKLSGELEKEAVESRLSRLLKTFETDELSIKTIDDETEKPGRWHTISLKRYLNNESLMETNSAFDKSDKIFVSGY